jgi:hypothetical protein
MRLLRLLALLLLVLVGTALSKPVDNRRIKPNAPNGRTPRAESEVAADGTIPGARPWNAEYQDNRDEADKQHQGRELQALLKLRDTTGFPWPGHKSRAWRDLEIHAEPSRCFGVKVWSSGRVRALELWGVGLSGSLPSELADLTAMTHFSVGGNRLTGWW